MLERENRTVNTRVRVIGGSKIHLVNKWGIVCRDCTKNSTFGFVRIDGLEHKISFKILQVEEEPPLQDEDDVFYDAVDTLHERPRSPDCVAHYTETVTNSKASVTPRPVYSDRRATFALSDNVEEGAFTFGGLFIEELKLSANPQQKTFLSRLAGDRVRSYTLTQKDLKDLVKNKGLPKTGVLNGVRYEVINSKLCGDGYEEWQAKRYKFKVTLVAVGGRGLNEVFLQEELDRIANFSALAPQKAKSRLELLESPSKSDLIYNNFSSFDIQLMDPSCERVHEGSGYYPVGFFGNKIKNGPIQIRLFAPRLGIFKAVLMPKLGIDRIQLPPPKVGPSLTSNQDWVSIVVTKTWPSQNNGQIARILDPCCGRKPTETFRRDIEERQRLKPSHMVLRVWRGLGVPKDLCREYADRSCTLEGLKHAWLVGAPDPTDALPEGHIFIPGMGVKHEKIFLTRSPCMEPSDGVLMPIVSEKPPSMSQEDWQHINSLSFGTVLFGPPTEGDCPLAAQVAGGDEDGDLYFACWDTEIMSYMKEYDPVVYTGADGVELVPNSESPGNEGWLEKARSVLLDAENLLLLHKLVGKLHRASLEAAYDAFDAFDDTEKEARPSKKYAYKRSLDINLHDKEPIQLAKAYKLSLDLGKHGGSIKLPLNLHECVPEDVRKFLC